MQFKSFHWISNYGLWVILPCASMKTNQTGSVLVHCNVPVCSCKIKLGRFLYICFEAFSIKQLFYSRLLDTR